LPDNIVIMAASNMTQSKAAANRMSMALANRFAHIILVPNKLDWRIWAESACIHPMLVAFIELRGDDLLNMAPDHPEQFAFPSSRSVARCSKYCEDDSATRRAAIHARCGNVFANEFEGFAALYSRVGDISQVLANPNSATMPQSISEAYAILAALTARGTADTMPAIVTYAERVADCFNSRELSSFCIRGTLRRNPDAASCRAAIEWQAANS
jgi:hypothetical protein